MEVAKDVPWPVASPTAPLAGDIALSFESAETGVEWIRVLEVSDQGGVWIANGRVLGGAWWNLEGTYFPGARHLPFPGNVAPLIAEADERFQYEGLLLRWSGPAGR